MGAGLLASESTDPRRLPSSPCVRAGESVAFSRGSFSVTATGSRRILTGFPQQATRFAHPCCLRPGLFETLPKDAPCVYVASSDTPVVPRSQQRNPFASVKLPEPEPPRRRTIKNRPGSVAGVGQPSRRTPADGLQPCGVTRSPRAKSPPVEVPSEAARRRGSGTDAASAWTATVIAPSPRERAPGPG